MREKGGNRSVPGPDYMVDALKLPKTKLPEFLGYHAPPKEGAPHSLRNATLQTCVACRCTDGTHLFCWSILGVSGQSLASNGPTVDSRDLNLVSVHTEATRNKLFFSSPTKYTIEPSWPTATAGSDVVQSGRPIFDDFFQHLWPYIGNNTANVVFQMVKRLWLIRIDQ
ncbi:hypothetical protein TNCV_2168401 [Trichonephila clavipes]|nr:hypothetical protein TNCV_2168401 [Trichonephila clavipes]